MSAVEPYDAWYFFAADNFDEVEREYKRYGTDEDGWEIWPGADALLDRVKVIAVEVDHGVQYVWILNRGQADRVESWMVRAAGVNKELAVPA